MRLLKQTRPLDMWRIEGVMLLDDIDDDEHPITSELL
jgi:hypothetical protein